MRIAVAGKVLDRNVGGNSRYADGLYSELRRAGIHVNVLRTRSRLTYRLFETFVWPLTMSLGDVLHYPADTGPIVASRIPSVGTVHGVAALHTTGVRSPRAEALWLWRTGRLVEIADHVITVSESSRSDILRAFDCEPGKITVIPHGIDHNRFRPAGSKDDDKAALKHLKLPEGYVLHVGNIEPRKNVTALVAASREIHAATGCLTVIAGAPAWDSADILAEIEAARYVRYLGRVSEEVMVPLLRRAAVFCFPSLYEGFGFPVLEAMACGTPVVCSNRGSLPEVAGTAAAMLDSTDGPCIAERVSQLLQDSSARTRLSSLGFEQALKYSWSRSASEHLKIFSQVATKRARGDR